jgi:LysM repeat protein
MMKAISKSLFLIIALALCGTGVSAQKRQTSIKAKEGSPTKSRLIRAHSGDTVLTISERYDVPAADLARVNHLRIESKLKKGQPIRIPAVVASADVESSATHGAVTGQRIKFTDGGTLNVDEAWRQGTVVWFKRGAVTQSLDREVKSIDPIYGSPAKEVVKQSQPQPAAPATATPSVTTWIYLVGGARVKVDDVNETSDGAWYSRNNLTVFLARERIERISRNEPDVIGQPGRVTDWTSGSTTIDRLIRTNGSRFGVDPYLVFLVIEQESHFRPRVVSPKGAQGLMQLMPGTARRFGVRRAFDPVENIRGGTQYLKQLLDMFGGRVDLALASYNAGEGRVIQYGHKIPPFRETQEYVRRISKRYGAGAGMRKNVRKAGAGE